MSIIGELFFDIPNDDWVQEAICTTTDPEIFHPEKGNQNHEARRICAQCPVRMPCLEWAMLHNERGIWGGFSERDRERLKRLQNPMLGKTMGHAEGCRCCVCRRTA